MTTTILLAIVVLFIAIVTTHATLRANSDVWPWYACVSALFWCIFVYLTFLHH